MGTRVRTVVWTCAVVALLGLCAVTPASAFMGTDTFTYTFKNVEASVTLVALEDPTHATVTVAVSIPDGGTLLIGGIQGTATDVGFPRGRPLRGRIQSLWLVGPEGQVQQVSVPPAARRPFRARNEAGLAREFGRRAARIVSRMYGDFFGLDDLF